MTDAADSTLAIQEPGSDAPAAAVESGGADVGALQAQIADLQQQVAQRDAMISVLQDKLDAVATVPQVAPQPYTPRLIGEDWSQKTSAEAKAAGVRHTVLCSDGYYCPDQTAG